MADLARVRVEWTGVAVTGPGVSTFYTSGDGSTLQAALITYFQAIKGEFPNLKGQWRLPADGEIIDSATGDLTGNWTGATQTDVQWNSASALWVAGVGTRAVWNTGGFLRGRRVRGSTFLVPLSLNSYDSDGTISNPQVASLAAAGNALIASVPTLTVWSRPTESGAADGGSTPITSCTVPDKVSWLRSRRT